MRKLSLVIAGILGAGSPLISQAATLGQAQVQSYLGEPLEVRVPLMRSSGEPLDEITAQLAPPAFYREAGVPLANLTGNLTFAIESERGQDYILIGSKRPIRDPIMSILLQVQSPQGRMIRSYNLLLDPPSVATSSPRTEQPSAQRQTQAPASQPSASSDWQRVEPAQDLDLDATRKVQRGDTLSEIARDYVGEGEDIRAVMQAIIDANPQAFANGNGNALMAGAELKVPSSNRDAETSGAQSGEPETVQRLPALELLSPDAESRAEAAAPGGFGDLSRDKPLPAIADSTRTPAQPMDRETALEQEELESVKAENEALTDQLRSLKEQIDSVKVAIEERDATIADLRQAVEESRQQAEQAQAQPPREDNFWVQWGKYLTGAMGLLIIALLIALGLRRARTDEEPAVPMPTTADATQKARPDQPTDRARSTATVTGATAAGAAAGGMAAGTEDDTSEPASTATSGDDPMNPEMALEEARVLESFNLTHQALELLEESLAEHPGHAGLQAAISRMSSGAKPDGIKEEGQKPEDTDVASADEQQADQTTETDSTEEMPRQQSAEGEARDADRETDTDREPGAEEGARRPLEQPGEIAWDDDFDDMLATPETRAEPPSDDNLMEFDDSFALETPADESAEDESKTTGRPIQDEDTSLELPEDDYPTTDVEDQPKTFDEEPDALDLDLSDYQTGSADSELGAEPETGPETEEEPAAEEKATTSATESEADVDTRVSLAEAFLDVGDRESFDMIEAELREEGATDALRRLDELKQRYES